MSIKTTHMVTREFALAAIYQKLISADNSQLAEILEDSIHNGFYNFEVVSQENYDIDEKEPYPMPKLNDLNNLPEYNDVW